MQLNVSPYITSGTLVSLVMICLRVIPIIVVLLVFGSDISCGKQVMKGWWQTCGMMQG